MCGGEVKNARIIFPKEETFLDSNPEKTTQTHSRCVDAGFDGAGGDRRGGGPSASADRLGRRDGVEHLPRKLRHRAPAVVSRRPNKMWLWSFPEREKRAGEDREQLVDRPSRPTGERAGRRAILEGRQPRGDDVVEDGDDEERPSRAREDVGRGRCGCARERYRRDGRRRKTTVEFGRRAEKSTDDDDDNATRSIDAKTNVDGGVERKTPDGGERTRRRTRVEEFVLVLRRAESDTRDGDECSRAFAYFGGGGLGEQQRWFEQQFGKEE